MWPDLGMRDTPLTHLPSLYHINISEYQFFPSWTTEVVIKCILSLVKTWHITFFSWLYHEWKTIQIYTNCPWWNNVTPPLKNKIGPSLFCEERTNLDPFVLGRVIPYENMAGETVLEDCICLETNTLRIVCDALLILVIHIQPQNHILNGDCNYKQQNQW